MIFRSDKKIDGVFFLQFFDRVGYGRLGDIKLLGGLCDAVILTDGTEIF